MRRSRGQRVGALALLSLLFACQSAPQVSDEKVEPPKPEKVRIALGGDTMFGRWVDGAWQAYDRPEIRDRASSVFEEADLALVNLETSICGESEAVDESPERGAIRLTAPPESIRLLARMNVDVVSLANNHAHDCRGGIDRSVRLLDEHGLGYLGVSRDGGEWTGEVKGMTVVGTAATLFPPRRASGERTYTARYVAHDRFDTFVEHVRALRREYPGALLVVSLHWGTEGSPGVSAWQRKQARALVGAGATIVHGHGTHTVQDVEGIDGSVVAYGMGNLHFDMRQPETRRRAIAWVECRVEQEPRCEVELRDIGP